LIGGWGRGETVKQLHPVADEMTQSRKGLESDGGIAVSRSKKMQHISNRHFFGVPRKVGGRSIPKPTKERATRARKERGRGDPKRVFTVKEKCLKTFIKKLVLKTRGNLAEGRTAHDATGEKRQTSTMPLIQNYAMDEVRGGAD